MDFFYLPDSITYQSRVYAYGSKDQSWVNINENSPDKQGKRERNNECSKDPRNCSICKSRQKRALSTYIMKTRRDSDRDTFIEEEEEEEEPKEAKKSPPKPTERSTVTTK